MHRKGPYSSKFTHLGSAVSSEKKESGIQEYETNNANTNDLLNDFKTLLEKNDFADFTFSVGGTDFRVHKAIVSARCSVFAAMVQHDMKEKNENRATIDDITAETFKEVLRFIYTGKVSNLDGLVDELVKASDKYDLRGLKNICEEKLCQALSPQNAAITLKFAEMFSCEKLKDRTIVYIGKNFKEVKKSDAWNNLVSTPAAKLVGEVCNFGILNNESNENESSSDESSSSEEDSF